MLIACVVHNQVEYDAQPTRMGFGDQCVHVFECSIWSIDFLIVPDIVAHVYLRAVIHGTDPDDVNPQIFDVVKRRDDAWVTVSPR